MSQWVSVPDEVMRNALQVVLGFWNTDVISDLNSDFPRQLVEGLIDFFQESGGCDHSVGICCCAEEQALSELKLALEGKQSCPQCHGEGFDVQDDQFVNCPRCDSSGAVPVGISPPSTPLHQT